MFHTKNCVENTEMATIQKFY